MSDLELAQRILALEREIRRLKNNFDPVFTYTPTWNSASDPQPAIVDGTLTGQYIRRGGFCLVQINWAAGASTTFGTGAWRFSLPIAVSASAAIAQGLAAIYDANTTNRYVRTILLAASDTYITTFISDAATPINITPTVPFTWAASDSLRIQIEYRT